MSRRHTRASTPTTASTHRRHAEHTPLEIDKITAIATDPDLYALAAEIPHRTPGEPGRPCSHPPVVWLFYIAIAGALGSHRKAASALAGNEHYWQLLRRAARKTNNQQLPKRPPSRNQCEYHRGKLANRLDTLLARWRDLVAARATTHDCFDPAVPRSTTELPRGSFVAVDGKVLPSPIRKKTAEKWRAEGRHIDGDDHVQGGDDAHPVFGTKTIFATARADNTRNDRLIVDLRHVPPSGGGGEAGIAVDAIRGLAARAPGLRGVCYDGALRGKHIDPLIKAGLTVLSPTNKGIGPAALEPISCPCGQTHQLWTADGRICQPEVLDTGDTAYRPCPVAKRYWRRNPGNGSYRYYQDVAVTPCGTIHSQRVDTTPEDRKRGYNRTEHLRQHVKTNTDDSVYDHQYGIREDVESSNDLLQTTMHKGRAPAFTANRQLLWALGYAISRNSLAHHLRAKRGTDPPQHAA